MSVREPMMDGFARLDLGCREEADSHAQVRQVTRALLPLLGSQPDLLIVTGTSSDALGAALAGFVAKVPVGHLDAGLWVRTRSRSPETEYGIAIDMDAHLLFAPDEPAAERLRAKGARGEIHIGSSQPSIRTLPSSDDREGEQIAAIIADWLKQSR